MLRKDIENRPNRYFIEDTETTYEIEEDMVAEKSLGDHTENILWNHNYDD